MPGNGERAVRLLLQRESDAFFCDAHADEHRCDGEEAILPIVNSPRMGVCGYTGGLILD